MAPGTVPDRRFHPVLSSHPANAGVVWVEGASRPWQQAGLLPLGRDGIGQVWGKEQRCMTTAFIRARKQGWRGFGRAVVEVKRGSVGTGKYVGLIFSCRRPGTEIVRDMKKSSKEKVTRKMS